MNHQSDDQIETFPTTQFHGQFYFVFNWMPQRTCVVLPFDLFLDQVLIVISNSSLNSSSLAGIGSNYRFVILFVHFVICSRISLMCCFPCNFEYLRSFDMLGCWKFAGSLVRSLTSGSQLYSWRLLLKFLYDPDHLLVFEVNCL